MKTSAGAKRARVQTENCNLGMESRNMAGIHEPGHDDATIGRGTNPCWQGSGFDDWDNFAGDWQAIRSMLIRPVPRIGSPAAIPSTPLIRRYVPHFPTPS